VFFLGLHGSPGEDGTIQGLLESCGRAYTGSGVRASALCMDKQALRLLASEAGARVAPGVCASRRAWDASAPAITDRILSLSRAGDSEARWVVKPRSGGSSVETRVVGAGRELGAAVEAALAVDEHVLIEAFVPGVEVSCGVLGNADEPLRALPPIEIRPADGRFFDYQQKYDADGATELCPAPSLDEAADRRVRALAVLAHEAGGCDGYSRVDFIVPPGGDPVLLEVNTLPGLTERSLLPQEAAAEGTSYRDLCLFILERALSRRSRP
jgi:D-alanine-D-alanine ligase